MNSAHALRYLILAMWGTAVAGGILDFSLESRLPEPLRDYLDAEWDRDLNSREWVGLVAGLVSLWFLLRGSILLYRLRARGRRPFLAGLIISVLAMPLFGPVIYNPWSPLFYEASMVLGGVVVGWIYFSSVPLELSDNPTSDGRPPPIG